MSTTTFNADNLVTAQRTELAFIDTRLADYQTLIASLPSNMEYVLIDEGDGMQLMADALAGRSGVDAIHVFSHGTSGQLQLGNSLLSSNTLSNYASQLSAISNSLSADGDILLYGCNVADGTVGTEFIGKLAQVTGADVAASTNLTGAANRGGDWVLEAQTGNILSGILNITSYMGVLGTTVSFSGINAAMGVTDGQWGSTDLPGVVLEFGFRTTAGDYPIDAVYTAGGLPALAPDTSALISRFFRIASNDNTKDFTISSFKVYNDSGSAKTLTITGSSDGIVYFGGLQTGTTIGTSSPSVPTGWSTVNLTGFTDISSLVIDYTDDIKMYFNDFVFGPPNADPALGGTFTTAGTVNDNATTTPFTGVTYSDSDASNTAYTVNITYTAANGSLAGTGLSGSAGSYTVTGSSTADVQSKLQALTFTPTANQVAVGSTVPTTFTLTPNDGIASGTANNTTVVTATSMNDAPTDITLSNASITVYDAANAVVGILSSTDPDPSSTFTYSLVSGTGSADNASFNISGSSLRATNPSGLTAGNYSVRVSTNDGSATYEEALTITVTDALTVTTNLDSGADATTGGGYAAELADGGGLSLREAAALASAGGKTINFAASLSGQTIALGSSLTLPTNTTLVVSH